MVLTLVQEPTIDNTAAECISTSSLGSFIEKFEIYTRVYLNWSVISSIQNRLANIPVNI